MEALALGYRGRRVLITGDTGFKGAWLALWLHQLGAQVTGVALPPETQPNLFDATRLSELITHHDGDIRDALGLSRLIARAQPEIIFHLAAQALVRRGYRQPIETLATNVLGTAHLLEAARLCDSVRAIIIVTTDKCYENPGWPWGFRENDRLGGHDPYSASKACAEIVTAAWRAAYWRNEDAPLVATARAGNVIGGGDWAEDRLIPDLVRAARQGETASIRYPDAVRPWQHVLEPLAGYLLLGARLIAGERRFAKAWNFGPALADMLPVAALCDAICPALGGRWRSVAGAHPPEASVLRLDSSQAVLELGWQPRWPINTALSATADWYRAFYDGVDARLLCQHQIDAYLSS
ncbi:MAG: CDP-glucose 4,6-dehydratase [Rhodocyclaceae bacterium]|nr:CDP-glucose 4,6-dehydratase [Rhodocyclaceae bacterium]